MPYALAPLADDHEGEARRERGRGGEGDGAEGGAGDPGRAGLELAHGGSKALAERPEQVGLRLEAVLVQVPGRALPGAEDEVALEQRVRAQPGAELVHSESAAGEGEQPLALR